ncbi:MAG TPA: MotA/TolQ/ExbB proton channel family protein [Phycisphaerae bacterium]|nr:MotA/TolQ/ExbB proton channel family protein [Phycisphaerae bacterium]
MDISTLIGLILGVGLLSWAVMSKSDLGTFVDGGSVAIVLGGSVAAAMISFPLGNLLGVFRVIRNAFFTKPHNATALIKDLVSYAEIARRDGILSLENVANENDDPFIVSGIRMAVDGTDPELIEQIMQSELDSVATRHEAGRALFENVGKYAPAFGMIGTLVGLVVMLKNMDDPSAIGPGMAVALLTTLYGSLLANLVALPLADKLGTRSRDEMLLKEIVIRGVMAIQSGDNPRVVEQKLKSFLPHRLRVSQDERKAA